MSRSIPLSQLPEDVRKRLRTGNRVVAKGKAVKALRAEQAKFRRELFFTMLERAGLPKPEHEWRFHPERQWRFDYSWVAQKIALEVDGGAFSDGRHSRGAGMRRDNEKLNAAIVLGWRVFRVFPEQLTTRGTETMLRKVLHENP